MTLLGILLALALERLLSQTLPLGRPTLPGLLISRAGDAAWLQSPWAPPLLLAIPVLLLFLRVAVRCRLTAVDAGLYLLAVVAAVVSQAWVSHWDSAVVDLFLVPAVVLRLGCLCLRLVTACRCR